MSPVKQEDELGCGVSCVAFILSISYENALDLFINGIRKAKSQGFLCKDLVTVLKKAGLSYEFKYIKIKIRKKIYKENTIVYLRKSKKYPLGHYLVRSDNRWMDPWINFPSEDIKAGFRKRLPEKPIYSILCTNR